MAFFKFRKNADEQHPPAAAAESVEALRKRARHRLIGAAVLVLLGVIGFVGLVCPHMVRRIIGDDQRFLIPGSAVAGAVLLLASDTVARVIVAPYVLPVAVLTAFMGAPVFIYLLFRGYRR